MIVITVASRKGGSGKSTLTSSLAVAAHEAGERVFVIDMDPQRSLVKWAEMRGVDDVPVSAVTPGRLPATLAALEKNGFTLAIIDTAGAEGGSAEAENAPVGSRQPVGRRALAGRGGRRSRRGGGHADQGQQRQRRHE